MLLFNILGILTLLTAGSCRMIDIMPKPKTLGKQLFLSRHVVTESSEFDGGVLVNEEGIIDAVLKRDMINSILSQNLNELKIIDGGELALMAGVVDSHVHINEPGRNSWEGFVTATQAAAVGGITTIIDMPLNSIPPTTTLDNLRSKVSIAQGEVFIDVGFWGGVVPGNEIELHDLIRAGVVGFKCFLTDSGVLEFPEVTATDLKKVFTVLNGTGTVLAFHAEVTNNSRSNNVCNKGGCSDPTLFTTYMATHPEDMELEAVKLITSFLPHTDVHVHIVHVSAEGVVPILEQAREERLKSGFKGWRGGITAETCNHYLTLSSEQIPPGHSEFKCSPPIRNNTNKQKLWEHIRKGRLDLVVSDHSPSVEDLKGTNFLTAWGGISSLQFDLPLFWTEAKARGYSLSTVSHYLSAGPARLVGLQDRKGALRPGLDADLIFFDPNGSFIVTPEVIRYKNKISPYMNRVLNGIVHRTYLRGQLIYSDGDLVGKEARGQLLLREAYELPKNETKHEETIVLEMDQIHHLDENDTATRILKPHISMPSISETIAQISAKKSNAQEDNGNHTKDILSNMTTSIDNKIKHVDYPIIMENFEDGANLETNKTAVKAEDHFNNKATIPNNGALQPAKPIETMEVETAKNFRVNSATCITSNLLMFFITVGVVTKYIM
ncbi:uncharacterized protein LOC114353175 isoform X1 [Ostrinia furnacalis]|uniref:uncharacterized protein LOC114353175 isoform X1 n=1 Tax=Ostrinia furnacalis TaxID=93504 RepID=UPI001038B6DD|nr:uncharacterized protein LOC114353175 isoform X1 [Ostrinia furnacalis]